MDLTRNKIIRFLLLTALIVGIAYGICIPKLSFYGDDWIYIYNYHLAGAKSFTQFTQWDRPYSAWIYILTSAAFGEGPLGYHLYVLLMRWLAVFLFWRILTSAFGERRSVDAAALLFAVSMFLVCRLLLKKYNDDAYREWAVISLPGISPLTKTDGGKPARAGLRTHRQGHLADQR